ALKKLWFILQNGPMNGDPDVLEYYKKEHSKKTLQIINLNFCKQLDVGLTFNKKELQKSFMFDLKTNGCTFYLVAETEADMNRVRSQVHGFYSLPKPSQHSAFGDLLADSAIAPPPRHPKTPHWAALYKDLQSVTTRTQRKAEKVPAGLLNIQKSRSVNKDLQSVTTRTQRKAEKVPAGLLNIQKSRSDSASSDDNYVPINPGFDIPISTVPHHFDPLGYPFTALPIHRGSSRGS
ncbi:GRB2-associated-binding protein 2, partial [Cricetulus griseus]